MRNFSGRLARLERQRAAQLGHYRFYIYWEEEPGVLIGAGGRVVQPENLLHDVETIVLSWGDSDERTYE